MIAMPIAWVARMKNSAARDGSEPAKKPLSALTTT
jgi:hypothetical protein